VKFVPAYENAKLEGNLQYITGTHFVNDPTFHKTDVVSGNDRDPPAVTHRWIYSFHFKRNDHCFLGKAGEFNTSEHPFEVTLEGGVDASPAASAGIKLASIDINKPLAECGKKNDVAGNSVWAIFLLGFLGGLIALLTPCVFPMIPGYGFFLYQKSRQPQTGHSQWRDVWVLYLFDLFAGQCSLSFIGKCAAGDL
jgi:hypothetical protein